MVELSSLAARRIVETVGSSGTPPPWGFQHFTAGIEPYLEVLEDDYFKEYLAEGGATFKLLVGTYGGGKTHFLYSVRSLGWKHGYPVAYVPLSHDASPFHRLDKVYAAIARSISLPATGDEVLGGLELGLLPLLKSWHVRLQADLRENGIGEEELAEAEVEVVRRALQGIESLQVQKALVGAMEALAMGRDDDLADLLQWLSGEGYARDRHRKYGLLHGIDRGIALSAIRSLVQWIRQMGYPGLCILFDEAEQVPSLSTKQRDALLSNLRELIDECGHHHFQGVMMIYAVPDENFFEGRSSVYEALNQRISSVFEVFNPTGVTIRLDDLEMEPLELLQSVGEKLAVIYEVAYGMKLKNASAAVSAVAKAAHEQRFGDIGYKRLFVQGCIRAFHLIRKDRATPLDLTAARKLVT
jgi:hypothetical protein